MIFVWLIISSIAVQTICQAYTDPISSNRPTFQKSPIINGNPFYPSVLPNEPLSKNSPLVNSNPSKSQIFPMIPSFQNSPLVNGNPQYTSVLSDRPSFKNVLSRRVDEAISTYPKLISSKGPGGARGHLGRPAVLSQI